MKKTLRLNRETVRRLDCEELDGAAGGRPTPPVYASINTLCYAVSLPHYCADTHLCTTP
jgi:hypothetical protein